MHRKLASLVLFRNVGGNFILQGLGKLFREWERLQGRQSEWREADGCVDFLEQAHELANQMFGLTVSFGLDGDAWLVTLAHWLATCENPFTLSLERGGEIGGTLAALAKRDVQVIFDLVHYDFEGIGKALGTSCFQYVRERGEGEASSRVFCGGAAERIHSLCETLKGAKDARALYRELVGFYQGNGVGAYGLYTAFRVVSDAKGARVVPIADDKGADLDELIGYEGQKRQLLENTQAFVEGRGANNVLLYGDGGTGKSTCVRAILSRFEGRRLRILEAYKHQLEALPSIMEQLKERNYKYILYMDDLSFEEFEVGYKYLKAIIEGGLEGKPDNVLIYATSNRRHLIRETFGDRSDMSQDELHHSDAVQEKLSLAGRFGAFVYFPKPTQKEFFQIVLGLARRNPRIDLSDEELTEQANRWSLRNGGLSGRTARQFVTYLESKTAGGV